MDSVNKTLYIPLYGKAYVSRRGILLHDPKAQEIWAAEGFPLKGKSRSKWLAFYMGIRSGVFDRWTEEAMTAAPDACVLHLGCGMDSRALRVGTRGHRWFDVDFPDVIRERQRYFEENMEYRMIPSDIRDTAWLERLPRGGEAIVVMEGISMYLRREALAAILSALSARFDRVRLLMDCYSEFAARASRYKNPINDVGVMEVHGLDDPRLLEEVSGFTFLRQHEMSPDSFVRQLSGSEQVVFRTVYGGKFAKKLYRMYEYRKG